MSTQSIKKVDLETQESLQSKPRKKGLYHRMAQYATHKHALLWANVVAFAESSFFPLPPDIMILPMLIANPSLAFRVAWTCTISSVIGGLVGYAIGFYIFATVGAWIIETYSLQQGFAQFQHQFQEWGFWIIALKGLTPIPYKLVTIASGVAKLDLLKFVIASFIARGFRFTMLSATLYYVGPYAKSYLEKYLGIFMFLILGGIVLGYVIVKWILG